MGDYGPVVGMIGGISGNIMVKMRDYWLERAGLARDLVLFGDADNRDETFAEGTVNCPDEPLEQDEIHNVDEGESEGSAALLIAEGLATDTGKRLPSKYGNLKILKLTPKATDLRTEKRKKFEADRRR